MLKESSAQIADDLIEAINSRDPQRMAGLCARDFQGIDVGHADILQGPEGIRQALYDYLLAFPDAEITTLDTIVESDRIVQIWTASGTHTGKLMRIPPTGRRVTVRGVSILTVRNGQVIRGLYIWDYAGLLRSIGLLPEL